MNKLNGRAGGRASVIGVMLALAGGSAALGQAVLDVYGTTLTNYRASASAAQGVSPHFVQRATGMDGIARSGSLWGWSFAANSIGGVGSPTASIGSVDLATQAYKAQEVDLALPATGSGRWTIGRSYNVRQRAGGSAIDSNGPQGYNWFQSSQPEIAFAAGATADLDVVYLVFGADRYIEFKRTTSTSNVFKSKNGAAGVVEYKSGSPDTYEYTDQAGIVTTFFGGNTSSNRANWQVWKIADPAGNTAYVGDASSASTAATSGYNTDKTISKAYDAAGRRYSYTYATVGVSRLTQVAAQTKSGGTWASPTGVATVGQVDYTYYTSDEAGRGKTGDLKMVTTTTPLSSGVDLVKKKYYRYYDDAWANSDGRRGTEHALKMVVGYEGCRNFDWAGDSTLDDDFLTASDADLKPYSEAWFEYEISSSPNRRRITKAFFNGECGCSGGSGTGTYTFIGGELSGLAPNNYSTYVGDPNYNTGYATRTMVTRPDGTWATYYFDEVGQPLEMAVTNTDPSSSPSQTWATKTLRNSDGVGTAVSTPANNSYSHGSAVVTPVVSGPTARLVQGSHLVDAGDVTAGVSSNLLNLQTSTRWAEGTSAAGDLRTSRVIGTVSKTIGSGTTVDIVRPRINESWLYTTDGQTTEANAGNSVSPTGTAYVTTMAYTYWGSGAELTPKVVTVTAPSVSTGNNGPGASAVSTRYMRRDGTSAFSLTPEGNYAYSEYQNGLLVRQIRDAKTNGSFASGDDPSTDFGITETGDGDNLVTTMSYDAQGRLIESVAPDWQGASGSPTQVMYFTRLADQRAVVLSVPRRTVSGGTTTYTGPVSYSVMNHAGRVEFSATLVLPSGSTTTAISTWIDTTDSDPIQAVALSGASLFQIGTSVFSADGARLNASRTYFSNPSSLPGTSGTHYDERSFGYDDMGRQWRAKDATGTISRSVFDALGRVSEHWIGTNDNSFAGGEATGTDNMTKTEITVYDGGSSGGNSLVTSRTKDPDGNWNNTGTGGNPPDDRRTTTYAYDSRNRLVLTTNPQSPHTVTKYDSAGRAIATGTYSSGSGLSASTDPTSTTTNRISLSEAAYDEAGRIYQTTTHKITLSTGASADTLLTNTWHDVVGRTIKTQGSSISKTFYDRQSRPYRQFTIAKTDDTTSAHAANVTGDHVVEERQTVFDTLSGLTLFTVSLQRLHNDTTTGTLDGNADGDITTLTVASGGTNVDYTKVRVAGVTAVWYDDLRRSIASANYGTNSNSSGAAGNGATFTRPSSAPSTSSTVLVSTTTYAADGSVLESTDPRGIKSRTLHDDAGKITKSIRNYVDGTAGGGANADEDQVIEYGYTRGLMTTYVARVPGGTDQTTTYIYGSSKGTGGGQSAIATGGLQRAIKYPDSSNSGTTLANMDSDSSDVVSVGYNSLGQEIYRKNQAGDVVQTDYDTSGRTIYRRATSTVGSVNTDVLRIGLTYTSRGQIDAVTQFTNATVGSGSVVDEVKYAYDDWGNVVSFRQDRDSAISASGGANGYQEVAYAFTKATPTSGAVAVRPTTITLPGSFDVTFDYGTSGGVNDCMSRVSSVQVSSMPIASYEYLGAGTLISTELPVVGSLSRLYDTATPASFDGMDQFGRTKISRWIRTGGGAEFYHVGLNYDYDGNVTSADDTVLAGFDATYAMDGLNRLIAADEGTLSSGSIGSRTRKETWSLNQVGGWTGFTSDLNGDGSLSSPAFGPTDEKNETRTFNTVNEMSTRVNNGVTKSPAYNANGQQTDDGVNYTYEWDVWGRLTKVSTRGGSPATVVQYKYNGLNYQIGRHADLDSDGDVDSSDKWEWFVYDSQWRRVSVIMVAGGADMTGSADISAASNRIKERYIHHASGALGRGSPVDSIILRDRDQTNGTNGSADGTLESQLYYCQNWRGDVSVTMAGSGRILEWIKYSAYGVAIRRSAADFNGDGVVDGADYSDFYTCYGGGACPAGPGVDRNFDSIGDFFDESDFVDTYAEALTSARGQLAQTSGSAALNRIGYAGYFFEPSIQQYLVRHRELDPIVGVWDERDPIGYRDGPDLYGYVKSNPIASIDPQGLISASCGSGGCAAAGRQMPPMDWSIQLLLQMLRCQDANAMARAATAACGGRINVYPVNCNKQGDYDQDEIDIPADPDGYDPGGRTPTPRGTGELCGFTVPPRQARIWGIPYGCTTPTIFLCSPTPSGCDRCKTLIHEYQHAIDMCQLWGVPGSWGTCRTPAGFNSCASQICLELRAYSRAGDCLGLTGPAWDTCICSKACGSVGTRCPTCMTSCAAMLAAGSCSGVPAGGPSAWPQTTPGTPMAPLPPNFLRPPGLPVTP